MTIARKGPGRHDPVERSDGVRRARRGARHRDRSTVRRQFEHLIRGRSRRCCGATASPRAGSASAIGARSTTRSRPGSRRRCCAAQRSDDGRALVQGGRAGPALRHQDRARRELAAPARRVRPCGGREARHRRLGGRLGAGRARFEGSRPAPASPSRRPASTCTRFKARSSCSASPATSSPTSRARSTATCTSSPGGPRGRCSAGTSSTHGCSPPARLCSPSSGRGARAARSKTGGVAHRLHRRAVTTHDRATPPAHAALRPRKHAVHAAEHARVRQRRGHHRPRGRGPAHREGRRAPAGEALPRGLPRTGQGGPRPHQRARHRLGARRPAGGPPRPPRRRSPPQGRHARGRGAARHPPHGVRGGARRRDRRASASCRPSRARSASSTPSTSPAARRACSASPSARRTTPPAWRSSGPRPARSS